MAKRMTSQKIYEYIAMNWGKIPVDEISKQVLVKPADLHTYVVRMRRRGVPIPFASTLPQRRRKRGKNVDYVAIKKLLEERT